MGMYKILLAIALVLGIGPQALAADVEYDSGDGPPMRFHSTEQTVIIHKDIHPINLVGNTALDDLRTFVCKSSAGCVVTAKIWVSTQGGAGRATVSGYIDNRRMGPASFPNGSDILTAQQSAIVDTGLHTVRTKGDDSEIGCIATGFEIEYAIYDQAQ